MLSSKKNLLFMLFLVLLVCLLPLLLGKSRVSLSFQGSSFTVSGPEDYCFEIDFDAIETIELVVLPEAENFGTAIRGGEKSKTRYGSWNNDIWGEYSICASTALDRVVVVRCAGQQVYVFNYESEETTSSVYESIAAHLQEGRQSAPNS